ncbi:NAD(P)-binding domain-containing protein [Amycolatopsis sp. A133]|uniref:NAD(P)-binding domain-containing protein n=1 Tax=Amycolatopsis sp. A133 TaxID=3064472 RepID=UPI0027F421C8|nr:NAD(P)-binding domain-containing protein [Amycolatopsis sp. A133]MDQ7809099.1 NAD(P)-binding domain-containing protein [Amycolatopsis sp. A133]
MERMPTVEVMEHIAFLGLGRMGALMARRLLTTGHPLTVWNRTADKVTPLVEAGAAKATSPAEAVREADIVITMLADPDALAAVADVIADHLPAGSHWIEMSTVGPDAVHQLAERIDRSVTLVDAPVMGSSDKAATGGLRILAGGEVGGVEHVLTRLGTISRTGPLGTGAALKLVVNSAVLGGVAVIAEAMRLADAFGLPEDVARSALATGPLAGAAARAFAEGLHFATPLAVKDLDLAADAVHLPVLETVSGQYRRFAGTGDIAEAATRIRFAEGKPVKITIDSPASAPQPLNPLYSQVARVEQADGSALLFLSGQIAEGDTLAEQTRGIFEALQALLKAHGATLADVVNIRTYLTDIGKVREYGAVRREFLTGTPPTSMTFEVSKLFRPEALVEVEVVAVTGPRTR